MSIDGLLTRTFIDGLTGPMFVLVLEGDYRRVHNRSPRGRRVWKFRLAKHPRGDREQWELTKVGRVMEYEDACDIAREVAHQLGFRYLYVEPLTDEKRSSR